MLTAPARDPGTDFESALTKTPKVVVSSDPEENAKPSVWFESRDGKLIPAEKAFALASKFQRRFGTTLSML